MAYHKDGYVLVHKDTKIAVHEGEQVIDFRGDTAVVTDAQFPQSPNSTGRVYVRPEGEQYTQGYYPSVFGLVWVPEEEEVTGPETTNAA
jgi:hypothetical protein